MARKALLSGKTSLRTDANRDPLPFLLTIAVLDAFDYRYLSFSKH